MTQKYCLMALCLTLSLWGNAQPNVNDEAQVRAVLWDYINGRNNGVVAQLQNAFHANADLRYIRKDSLRIWHANDYIGGVKPGRKHDCKSRIVYVDIAGTAAQAKVEIEYANFKFADYINLLKEGNRWVIAVKTFARLPINPKKVLFVITSHEKMGETGRKTGLHLGEVSHVYKPLHDAGFEVDFVSPKGGKTYMYGTNMNDSLNVWFMRNASAYYKLTHAMQPGQINKADYAAIYFVGGHGTMWDLPGHEVINGITRHVYQNAGVIAAVCHGPSGLVNVKLDNGEYLVKGKRMTAFTDNEERAAKQEKHVPFMLESTLKERGAIFKGADNWQENVVVDGQLITGQNPASAYQLATKMIEALQ